MPAFRPLIVSLTMLILGVANAAQPAAHPEAQSEVVPNIDTAAIEAALNRHTLGAWWGAVLVSRNGDIKLAKGFGFANESLAPINADTIFDIASCSKAFTAAAVLKLAEQGVLSLDDRLDRFFPSFNGEAGQRAASITIRQVLAHTARLDDSHAMQPLDFPDRNAAVKAALAAEPLPQKSGFRYSNAGYVIAAAIIEKASGKPFEEAMKELVFAPAGLNATGFLNDPAIDEANAAVRTVDRGGKARRLTIHQDGWGWGLRGAGGILTTMADLAKWDASLTNGRVLSPESTAQMFAQGPGGYGLGWFTEPTSRSTTRIHHSGGTRGFTSWFIRLPQEHTFIAVLTNEKGRPDAIARLIEDTIFPPLPESGFGGFTLGDRTENEWGLAITDELLLWRPASIAERAEANAAATVVPSASTGLVLERATDGAAIMHLWLSPGTVARLRAELAGATPTSAHATAPAPASDSAAQAMLPSGLSLMTKACNATATTFGPLADGVTITVRDRYSGISKDGNPVEDIRPTFIVIDEARSMWPVIVRMDRHTADSLAQALQPTGE